MTAILIQLVERESRLAVDDDLSLAYLSSRFYSLTVIWRLHYETYSDIHICTYTRARTLMTDSFYRSVDTDLDDNSILHYLNYLEIYVYLIYTPCYLYNKYLNLEIILLSR